MADRQNIWVFSEKPALLAELLAGAKTLGSGPVTALMLGSRGEAEKAAGLGARQVIWLGELPEGALVDDYVATITQQFQQSPPDLLLIGSTRRGRAVAGRLAARLKIPILTDILDLQDQDGGLQARHMIFGGGAVRVERLAAEPAILTVGPGVFSAPTPANDPPGEVIEAAFVEPAWRVRLRERKTRPVSSVNLAAAKKVICAGRGLAREEDLKMISELAQVLGSEIACTRPLAEGLNWLPRERYIGISGAQIRPDLYFGVGVSGQAQHLIGMSRSRVVVALNKDSHAPIFNFADYGVVGDLYTILPALIRAIQAAR
jgi:electron transfer flavoprotein alpha subunit